MDTFFAILYSAAPPVGLLFLYLLYKIWRSPAPVPVENAAYVPESSRSGTESSPNGSESSPAEGVGAFYDATTDSFVQVYGEVIQAFRTHDLANLLDYQIAATGLKKGETAIDARLTPIHMR